MKGPWLSTYDHIGSTKRLIEHAARSTPDIKWFGAVGDGSTDDTQALKDALASSDSVFFPPGIYCVSETIMLDNEGCALICDNRSRAYVGPVILRWTGAVDGGPIVRVRNAHAGDIRNLGFDGYNRASSCIQFAHIQGDVQIVSNWTLYGCQFSNAREFNVIIGDEDQLVNGDNCNIVFINSYFGRSFIGAQTIAHVRQYAAETFQTCFINPRFNGYTEDDKPSYAYMADGGSADFHSAVFDTMGAADIYLTGRANVPLPAVNVFGAESQSTMLLKTAFSGSGAPAGQRVCVLAGVYQTDIVGVDSSSSIYWDGYGHTALVLAGVRTTGDIEIHSNSRVFSNATFFDDTSGNFTGSGEICGTWWKSNRFYQRFPDTPTHASNEAAVSAGLSVGDLYRSASGSLNVVY